MRRLVSGIARASRAWNTFFFAPADATPLGAIRVVTGSLLLWSMAVAALDLRAFLGSDGWADPATARRFMGPAAWSFWLAVPDSLLWPAWGLAIAILLAFTLGLGSRLTAPLAWAIAVSTARRAPVILFGFDQIVSTWAFYLAVTGASGQALAVDRWLAARRGRTQAVPPATIEANLALRLIQIHLCVIYGMAGLAKLQGPAWWDGTAIGKLLGNSEFRTFDLTGLAASPLALLALNLATHAALATEVFYPVLIWVRAWRPWMIAAALAMHAGIALILGLTEFSMAMAAGNLAFVSGPWLRSWVPSGLRDGRGRSRGIQFPEGGPVSPAAASAARPRRSPR